MVQNGMYEKCVIYAHDLKPIIYAIHGSIPAHTLERAKNTTP